jgi:class 3 adenylate cyclase
VKHTIEGPIVDPAAAWALVGDSDHMNRLADTAPLRMEMVTAPDGHTEVQGTIIGPGPIRHGFRELDASWVQGRWFRNRRQITGPLLRASGYAVELVPEDGGVRPRVTQELVPSIGLLEPIIGILGRKGMATWQRELDGLPRNGVGGISAPARNLPPPVLHALERWRGRPDVDAGVAGALQAWLERARDRELGNIRAFSLADAWGLERRAVVTAFLEATEAGLLELYWTVRCPRCHGSVAAADTLSNLSDAADCPGCQVHFGADLDQSVEVMFAAHKAIRPAAEERFCTLFPADRPETLALLDLAPGAEQQVEVDLPAGEWALGCGGTIPDRVLRVDDDGEPTLRWRPEREDAAAVLRQGTVTLDVANPTDQRMTVQLAGATAAQPRLSAAWLTTMPRYRRTFGSQVLAPDVRIGVRAMAVMFSDLSGSAALYHELGDAAAFRLVHDHFALLRGVVEATDGVVVKTIGDAIMAAFYDPERALSAALTMQRHYAAWAAELDMAAPPALKLGLHFGPVMAVHTDASGLDYFGETVNIAARAKGVAKGGEVVWTGAVQDDAGVAQRTRTLGEASYDDFVQAVKGIAQPMQMHRWPARGPTPG